MRDIIARAEVCRNDDAYGTPIPNLGAGAQSANPLYVNAQSNLRLTSNSSARFVGDFGNDLCTLPYTGDPTPGFYAAP